MKSIFSGESHVPSAKIIMPQIFQRSTADEDTNLSSIPLSRNRFPFSYIDIFRFFFWSQRSFQGVLSACSVSIDCTTANRKSRHWQVFTTHTSNSTQSAGKSIQRIIFMVQKTSACFSLRRVKQLQNTSSLCVSLLFGYLKHKGEDST